jgi:hypothetical protein
MVSQILSRDMVKDMVDKAETPSLGEIISEQIISEKILDNAQRADDSLKGVPDFTTTTIESEPTISLPAPKPKIQLPVSKPEFSDIKVPVSKPNQDTINEAIESFLPKSKPRGNLISEQIAKIVGEDDQVEDVFGGLGAIGGTESGEVEDVSDPQTIADFILGRGDAVFDTPTLGNLSRNVRVTRDAPKGDFSFSSDVPVEKLADLYKENTLEDVLTRQEEKQGLDLLAKILKARDNFLNLFRPQFTTESAGFEEIGGGEKFPPSTALRSDRFNDGGIVQGFRGGGVAKDRYEDFSSNISGNVGGRVDIRDIDDLGTEERVIKDIDDLGIYAKRYI